MIDRKTYDERRERERRDLTPSASPATDLTKAGALASGVEQGRIATMTDHFTKPCARCDCGGSRPSIIVDNSTVHAGAGFNSASLRRRRPMVPIAIRQSSARGEHPQP